MADFEKYSDPFTFVWIVDNLKLYPKNMGARISSPSFAVESIERTEWCVQLNSSWFQDEHVSLHLKRLPTEAGPEEIPVIYRFLIVDPIVGCNKECFWQVRYFIENFSDEMKDFVTKDAPASSFQNPDIPLMVVCQIQPFDEVRLAVPDWRPCMNPITLARDMKTLYTDNEFHDLVLRTTADSEFKLHRCVIAARVPRMLQAIDANALDETPVVKKVRNNEPCVLDPFLQFVYTEKLRVSEAYQLRELLLRLKRHHLLDLSKEKYVMPNGCIARTPMDNESIFFDWHFGDFEEEKWEALQLVRQLPIALQKNASLVLMCDITSGRDECLKISARFLGLETYPILMRCSIALVECEIESWTFETREHLFQNADDCWELPGASIKMPSAKNDQNGEVLVVHPLNNLKLRFEIDLCVDYSGENTSSDDELSASLQSATISSNQIDYESYREASDHKPVSILDDLYLPSDLSLDLTGLLGSNLLDIYKSKVYCDISIICRDVTFPVHKAIIAARSDFFHEILKRSDTDVIIVENSEPRSLHNMFVYIYSATLPNVKCDDVLDLYRLADEYQVHGLKNECLYFLTENINFFNACQLLIFADDNDEIVLKSRLTDFLFVHYDFFHSAVQFKYLAVERFDLVVEIIRQVIRQKFNAIS